MFERSGGSIARPKMDAGGPISNSLAFRISASNGQRKISGLQLSENFFKTKLKFKKYINFLNN